MLAGDRQQILYSTLRQLEERTVQFARRTRIHQLLRDHDRGEISPEQFRNQADVFLSSAISSTTGLLAAWIEDKAGHRLAGVGPERLIKAYSERRVPDDWLTSGVWMPPARVGDAFGTVFFADVRDNRDEVLGRALLLFDFAPTAGFLMDPHGLGETGELLVGIAREETIHLVLPYRQPSPRTEVLKADLPSLALASAGKFGFLRTTDDRGVDVLVAYRPVGSPYTNWGLIAKIDSTEAYADIQRIRRAALVAASTAFLLTMVGLTFVFAVVRNIRRTRRRVDQRTRLGESGAGKS
jgi:hypothetical protein